MPFGKNKSTFRSTSCRKVKQKRTPKGDFTLDPDLNPGTFHGVGARTAW